MLKQLESLDEVINFFDSLKGSFGEKIKLNQIYYAALQVQEQREKEKRIESQINDQFYRVLETYIINDDFQIVKLVNKRKTKDQTEWYSIFYQYRELHEFYPTFDTALVALLCAKYQNSTQPAQWIVKMLQMNEETNMNE